jgi:hypothetical protein
MITIRTVWTTLQDGPGLWARLLQGRLGRLLFRGSRWFARKRPPQPVAGQPTIAALGIEAEELFRALPPAVRDQLQDLPRVLAALRGEADRLHRRDDPGASARLAGVVGAMEAVRLELLGWGAGASSVPDVTRYLDEARQIAERVDRELGRRDDRLDPRAQPGYDTPT